MSGHNPHGRLGQPNASFNHLQVPFIPRQPQLAHVHMNDSILRSSPLNWHQSDAAFLNYMSTQHKTVRVHLVINIPNGFVDWILFFFFVLDSRWN